MIAEVLTMINIVVLMGKIVGDDPEVNTIRKLEIVEDYKNLDGVFQSDTVSVINWNKTNKGELFTFPVGSLVMIRGRMENYKDHFVVVCENLTYLGKC